MAKTYFQQAQAYVAKAENYLPAGFAAAGAYALNSNAASFFSNLTANSYVQTAAAHPMFGAGFAAVSFAVAAAATYYGADRVSAVYNAKDTKEVKAQGTEGQPDYKPEQPKKQSAANYARSFVNMIPVVGKHLPTAATVLSVASVGGIAHMVANDNKITAAATVIMSVYKAAPAIYTAASEYMGK